MVVPVVHLTSISHPGGALSKLWLAFIASRSDVVPLVKFPGNCNGLSLPRVFQIKWCCRGTSVLKARKCLAAFDKIVYAML